MKEREMEVKSGIKISFEMGYGEKDRRRVIEVVR